MSTQPAYFPPDSKLREAIEAGRRCIEFLAMGRGAEFAEQWRAFISDDRFGHMARIIADREYLRGPRFPRTDRPNPEYDAICKMEWLQWQMIGGGNADPDVAWAHMREASLNVLLDMAQAEYDSQSQQYDEWYRLATMPPLSPERMLARKFGRI